MWVRLTLLLCYLICIDAGGEQPAFFVGNISEAEGSFTSNAVSVIVDDGSVSIQGRELLFGLLKVGGINWNGYFLSSIWPDSVNLNRIAVAHRTERFAGVGEVSRQISEEGEQRPRCAYADLIGRSLAAIFHIHSEIIGGDLVKGQVIPFFTAIATLKSYRLNGEISTQLPDSGILSNRDRLPSVKGVHNEYGQTGKREPEHAKVLGVVALLAGALFLYCGWLRVWKLKGICDWREGRNIGFSFAAIGISIYFISIGIRLLEAY